MLPVKELNLGILNTRGCKTKNERIVICEDAYSYKLQVLAVTETHILGEEDVETIKINEKVYTFYSGGIEDSIHNNFTGVGVVIDNDLKPKFERVNDPICTAELNLDGSHKLVLIVTYAPTVIVSEQDPQKRVEFYKN